VQILCESCGAVVAGERIDLQRNLATCTACNQVFNCQAQLDDLGAGELLTRRPPVPLPKGVQVFHRSNGLRIVRRWFSAKAFVLLIFACFWDGFLVLWFTLATRHGQWSMAAFGSLHALVGLGLSYWVVALFVNNTVVTVLHGQLEVRHGPWPVPGNRCLPAQDLEQLYTRERVSHSENGTSISYELRARRRDGTDIKLVGSLERAEQAMYMEQQIEAFLGIKDRRVAGEGRG
jgi:hypothetical protein